MLYEFGQIVPQGIGHIKRIDAIIRDEAIDLPDIVREECRDLLAQIDEKTTRIEDKTVQLTNASRDSAAAQRLQSSAVPSDQVDVSNPTITENIGYYRFAACSQRRC